MLIRYEEKINKRYANYNNIILNLNLKRETETVESCYVEWFDSNRQLL